MRDCRLGLLLLPLLAVAGCGKGEQKARSSVERLPRVEIVKPTRTPLKRRIELAATVEALQRADLCARVPGTVDYLSKDIDIGRRVRRGEKLIRLAVPDLEADQKHKERMLEQAQNQVELAQQTLKVAVKEIEEAEQQLRRYVADEAYYDGRYERIRGLVRMGAQDRSVAEEALRQREAARAARRAAEKAVATRKAKALATQAELKVARGRVEVARAEVEKLKKLIEFATITAPFDGIITRRWVDSGATIKDAGAPLLTVMDLNRVRVLIDIPQREVPLVNTEEDTRMLTADASRTASPGLRTPGTQADQVVVRIPALAEVVPSGEFRGRITRLGKALDPVTRTMRAEIELDNPRGYLRPGMYGKADVLLDERANVLTVPATAMVRLGESKVGVYVVASPRGVPPRGELKLVELELGLDDGRRVEIRSGLKGDELVVAKGNGVLRAGDEVLALPLRDE